jgi:2-C-methyl-D-erythritol 4-phosphate cytidylyltransferase
MVEHTLSALLQVPRIEATLVVLSPQDDRFELCVPGLSARPDVWVARCGGASRASSVAAGLSELARRGVGENDWVLVHDAARCLVRPEWVDRLIDACLDDEVGGLLAVPVADTLKRGLDGRVATSVDRKAIWSAQTPQMFRLGLLRKALSGVADHVTDESAAIEQAGYAPKLVAGHLANFKLTWPEDFALAESLLQASHPTARPR